MSCSALLQRQQCAPDAPLSPPAGSGTSGTRLVTMERRRSVKTFRSQDEYLYAMKEDISEWFNSIYGISSTADDLLDHLETGSLLCRHAEQVQQYVISSFRCSVDDEAHYNEHYRASGGHVVRQSSTDSSGGSPTGRPRSLVSGAATSAESSMNGERCHRSNGSDDVTNCGSSVLAERMCWAGILSAAARSSAQPGSFHSRDNLCQFLAWCRRQMLIPDTLLFETDDLVLRKNERSVVLCLLEAARRAVRTYHFPSAPDLVRLEQEIDDEMAREATTKTTTTTTAVQPPVQRRPVIKFDMMSLDEMVRDILGRCTCPGRFPMVRVSEGRYRIGDSQTMIFIRILRSHVMVRIGGGWDTLENFLDRHDPCRCQSRGHRAMSVTSSSYSGPSSLSTSRSFDRTAPSSGDTSTTADLQQRHVTSCTSPTSLVTSVQTSGAWTTSAKSVTSRTENNVGQTNQQQQKQTQQQRIRPKTPIGDGNQKHTPPKLTPLSTSSNGRRTPVAKTTIDADISDNGSDKRVTMTTTASSSTTSAAHGRPKTPVNFGQKTANVSPRTPRDTVTTTTVSVQRRSKTPDIESNRNVASSTSADRAPTTPRGRSATRGLSLADATSSTPTTRGRSSARSSSVGRHEMTLRSSSDWPGNSGDRSQQRRGASPSTSSTLRRSGTSADIRRDAALAADEERSNPRVLLISRNTDGRHIVRDHVTQTEGHGVTARQKSQTNLNRNNTQPSKQQNQQRQQQQQTPQTSAPSTPRNQTASVTVRLSMTADKLLPSKLRVQQPQTKQLHSLGGDTESDVKRADDNDAVAKRASLNWSVNGALPSVAAPARGPLRRTASVGEPFIDVSENHVTTTDQSPPGTGSDGPSSTCRISVIKRSSSVETASPISSQTSDGGLSSMNGVADTTRLDNVDIAVDRSAPASKNSEDIVEFDGEDTSVGKYNGETVVTTATSSAESPTGSNCTLPASNVITGDSVCFSTDSTGDFTTSGGQNNVEDQRAVQAKVNSPTSTSFQTLLNSLPDLMPPEDDEEINSRMEMLFEEYRKVELGLMDLVWKANNEVDVSVGQHQNWAAKKTQRGSSTNGSSKVQKQVASRGREPVYSGRTPTTAAVRPPTTGEKQTQRSLTSDVRRSLSRPSSALEHAETATPTTPRSTERTSRLDISSTLSSPRGSARRSSSLHRGNSEIAVSQSYNIPSASTPKSASGAAYGMSTDGADRVGSRSPRVVSNGSVSCPAADRRRARSCVRLDDRGDLKRTMSVTFDVGGHANETDSDGDQTAADVTRVNHRELDVSSTGVEKQLLSLTTVTSIPPTLMTMTFARCRRRSYSRTTSDERTPTKIPMPVDAKRDLARMTSQESFDERLKRVDSGVDINNMI